MRILYGSLVLNCEILTVHSCSKQINDEEEAVVRVITEKRRRKKLFLTSLNTWINQYELNLAEVVKVGLIFFWLDIYDKSFSIKSLTLQFNIKNVVTQNLIYPYSIRCIKGIRSFTESCVRWYHRISQRYVCVYQ